MAAEIDGKRNYMERSFRKNCKMKVAFYKWLVKRRFKRETESLIMATQEHAIYKKYVKATIDRGKDASPGHSICGQALGTISHIISGCTGLARGVYKNTA